ncbi:M48 family metallopeptidase [Mycoplasma todarodis]|uniref:M48 family metallopeptidase n=1 Tax=Mycoplasma todarodis TaxID=1937191 RepID=UPI003B324EA2
METLTYYFDRKIFKIDIKRTNNKNMYLKMDGAKVVCSAPKNTSLVDIKTFVDQHALKFYEHSKKVKVNELYSLKDDFLFLFGRKYQIIRLTGFARTKIEIIDNKIYIKSKDNSDERTEKNIKKILKDKAEKYIKNRQIYFEKKMNIPTHTNKFVYKTSTWGSNYVKEHRIIYSTKLAHYRESVIDYVIVHELAHHLEPNHSSRFWVEVEKIIPDWKELRKELRADSKMSDE